MGWQSRLDVTLRTTVGVLLIPAALALVSLRVLVLSFLRAPRDRTDRAYWWFGRVGCRIAGTKLHVRGLDGVQPGKAYVLVPNHESNWDPVVLVAALETIPTRFVAKRQVIRIPVLGWALLRSGNVRVERTNTRGDVERIRREMEQRPLDVSILFYAEGTRSREGALREFRKGAFVTAISYGLPVLPMGHAGTYRIWRPRRFGIRSGPVAVEVGRPIPVDGLTYDDRDKLRDQTFEAVRELRTRARSRVRELGVDPGGID